MLAKCGWAPCASPDCRGGERRVSSRGGWGGSASHCRVGHRWYKDGALLTPSGKYRTLNEPRSGLLVLEILAANKEDLGHYECEVTWADIRVAEGTSLGPPITQCP